MKRFKKILAILPQNQAPTTLLRWSKALGEASSASAVHLLICQETALPSYPDNESQVLNDGATNSLHAEEISESMGSLPYEVNSLEDAPLRPTLDRLSSGEYDLVLVSVSDRESRLFAEKLARKSPVGLLLLPIGSQYPPENIFAAVDFSDISPLVLDWAERFATLSEEKCASMEAIHLTKIATSARATMAISPDALKKRILEDAADTLQSFLAQYAKSPKDWKSTLITSFNFGENLAHLGRKNSPDLLVLGSHGRNALSVALLGSEAAEVIRGSESAVLIVKKKNASLPFLRQLLGQPHSDS